MGFIVHSVPSVDVALEVRRQQSYCTHYCYYLASTSEKLTAPVKGSSPCNGVSEQERLIPMGVCFCRLQIWPGSRRPSRRYKGIWRNSQLVLRLRFSHGSLRLFDAMPWPDVLMIRAWELIEHFHDWHSSPCRQAGPD